jgi:DNA-binding protein WhiA
MSFSLSAKQEVLKTEIVNDCCSFAFLSGVIKGAGVVNKNNLNSTIEILTNLEGLFNVVNKIIKQYYGASCEVFTIKDYAALKLIRYKITIPSNVSTILLKDISVTHIDENNNLVEFSGIDHHIITQECCKKAYIKGIFVACATSNIVIKNYNNDSRNNSGYHLEFVFNNEKLAGDFVELLKEFEINSKITKRKNTPIVYIKEYQVICDTLALVGAYNAVMLLQNEAAIRDVRNNVNRQLNCFNANLSKMVASSVRQLNAIKIIQETVGIDSLDEPLQELSLLRIANPDEPLEKLRQLLNYQISKSGLNHRFEKIIKIANKIKQNEEKI